MKANELANRLLAQVEEQGPFQPSAYYDPDGDCFEFFISNEPFKAERLDKWVTVYHGRDSKDVVGGLIKNIRQLIEHFPGLDIDIEGGRVLLSLMLRGPAYVERDPVKHNIYKAVVKKLDDSKLTGELQTAYKKPVS